MSPGGARSSLTALEDKPCDVHSIMREALHGILKSLLRDFAASFYSVLHFLEPKRGNLDERIGMSCSLI